MFIHIHMLHSLINSNLQQLSSQTGEFLNLILMDKLCPLCIISAKMIIVEMPWIMNGENEPALS